jgi:hypothetical protein
MYRLETLESVSGGVCILGKVHGNSYKFAFSPRSEQSLVPSEWYIEVYVKALDSTSVWRQLSNNVTVPTLCFSFLNTLSHGMEYRILLLGHDEETICTSKKA